MSKVGGLWKTDSGFTGSENVSESNDARHSTCSRFSTNLGWSGHRHRNLPKTEATGGVGLYFGRGGDWAKYTALSSDFE